MPEVQYDVNNPPRVLGGVVPYMQVADAVAAAELYRVAFGAEEVGRAAGDDGKTILHLHLHINGGSVMLMDPMPQHGYPLQPPQAFNLHMQMEHGIDAAFQRAVDAGMEIVMPIADQFWGDRYGMVKDRFGVTWAMGQAKS